LEEVVKHVTAHAQRLDKLHSTKEAQLRSFWKKRRWKNRQTDEDKHKERLEAHRKAKERAAQAAMRLEEAAKKNREDRRDRLNGAIDMLLECHNDKKSVPLQVLWNLKNIRSQQDLMLADHREIVERLAKLATKVDNATADSNIRRMELFMAHGRFWSHVLAQAGDENYEPWKEISREEALGRLHERICGMRADKIYEMFKEGKTLYSVPHLSGWKQKINYERLVAQAPEAAIEAHNGDVGDAVNALVDDPIMFEDTPPEEAGPPEQPVSGSGEAANPFVFEDTPPEEEPAPASQTPEAEYDDDASL
jgi:hypothetical protein